MKRYNCLIVDDEPIARDIIAGYCANLNFLDVAATCGNALAAKHILEQQSIDILFLDIHMPVLDGVAFIKTLKTVPQLIFTTAYKEYAATAFDLAACDYLVKPFSIERFIVSVDKAVANLRQIPIDKEPTAPDHIFIRAEGKLNRVMLSDILYAEAKGNYTQVVTATKNLLTAVSFSSFEALVSATQFIKVHRSYIVNKDKLLHIEGNTIRIGESIIPIGSMYKAGFMKAMGL